MNDFDWKQYYREHACCPVCGNSDVGRTTAMSLPSRDTNNAFCPCGWRGIVHDLVPAKDTTN